MANKCVNIHDVEGGDVVQSKGHMLVDVCIMTERVDGAQ
jgi:hypothetical protein